MHMLMRILGSLPKNSALPAIAALAAYYIGGKYGAPDIYLNTIDGVLAQGGDLIGGMLGGENGGDAPTE